MRICYGQKNKRQRLQYIHLVLVLYYNILDMEYNNNFKYDLKVGQVKEIELDSFEDLSETEKELYLNNLKKNN